MARAIDNEERTMLDALSNALETSDSIDIFVGYFYFSGFQLLAEKLKGKKMMFYYQNQNYHETNEQKENELQAQLHKHLNIIGKHTEYSWWTYIRHFIIKN